MADATLTAEPRDEFGKGAARRIRRAGRVPAVIYDQGNPALHVTLDAHATMMALKTSNALLEIVGASDDARLAIAREVQINPVNRQIEHVDLFEVRRGEKIEVEIPVHMVGETDHGTMVSVDNLTIRVLAEATHIPDSIEFSVAGRKAGEHVYAGDIVLPAGIELTDDPELLLINISAEVTEAQREAELEAEGDAAAAPEAEAGAED